MSLTEERKILTDTEKLQNKLESAKKSSKKYYEANKEICLEKQRLWRQTENGKACKKKTDKAYREGEHREALLAKKREYHHENSERLAAQKKEYRKANAEAISVKKQADYLKEKEDGRCDQVKCECGGTFCLRSKARHIKTKKHTIWLDTTSTTTSTEDTEDTGDTQA